MKLCHYILLAGFAALGACEARNAAPAADVLAPAPAQAEAPAPPPPEADIAATEGLELLDSETGISILDVGPQDDVSGLSPPKFALHCDTAAKTLEAIGPSRQLGPYAVAGPAQFVASGQVFEGEAVLAQLDGAAVSLELPLTPDLLAAIATSTTVRVAIGDGFAESNVDTNGAFPGFAGQCSLESGVKLPPR